VIKIKRAIKFIFLIYLILTILGCSRRLNINDNGYVWQKANERQKLIVCKALSEKHGHKLEAEDYMSLIEYLYAVSDKTLPIWMLGAYITENYEDEDQKDILRIMKILRDPKELEKMFTDGPK